MIQDTDRFKMELVKGLERTVQGQVKPSMLLLPTTKYATLTLISIVITQCSIRHLYTLPQTIPSAQKSNLIELAKGFERRRCNHHTLDEPLSTLDCYKDVIDPKGSGTNKNRYVVASQGEDVRRWCRGVKGVPSVYVKRSVMVMEPMADSSIGVKEGMERGKLRGGLKGKAEKRKREDEEKGADNVNGAGSGSKGEEGERKKKRPWGLKGPNPLSVKKPKKERPRSDTIVNGDREADQTLKNNVTRESILEETQNPPAKKKRRRKHKSGPSEDLAGDEAGMHNTSG